MIFWESWKPWEPKESKSHPWELKDPETLRSLRSFRPWELLKKLKTKRFAVLNQDIVDPRNSSYNRRTLWTRFQTTPAPQNLKKHTPQIIIQVCHLRSTAKKTIWKILKIRHWTCRSRPQWLFESQAMLKRFWSEPRRRRLFQVVNRGLLFMSITVMVNVDE